MKKALIILALISVLALTLLGCSLEIFDWNQRAEIINDYLSWSGLKGDIEAYEVRYKHFGAYGDSVAIYFHTAGAYETPVEEEIAGYTFSYPDSRVIRIWNNGKFYKMPEAYDLGLITEDDVKRIYNQKIFLIFREPLFIFEEKIYCDYSRYDDWRFPGIITDLFYPDMIQVYIDANLSREGKIFDSAFFEDIEFLSIEDRSIDSNNTRGEPYRQYFQIKLLEPSTENVKTVISILEAKEGIRKAVPVGIPQPGATPNDTSYSVSNDDREYWGLKRIEAEKVWDFTTGTSDVRVGVIDTGIASHEDLNGNYSINDAFDFRDVLWTEPTYYAKGDSNYHGTHVAGIIGDLDEILKGEKL